jgi:type IV pilus assembly protein PilM
VLLSETETGLRLEALAIEPMPKGAMSERNIQDIEAIGNVITKLKRKLPSHSNLLLLLFQGKQ